MHIPPTDRTPLPRRAGRALLAGLLTVAVSAPVAACGGGDEAPPPVATSDGPPPDPTRAALAALAAAAQDRVGVGTYTLTGGERPDRTVTVVRATDGGWRVDVPGGVLGGTADVSIIRTGQPPAGEPQSGSGLHHCSAAAPAAPARCVPVETVPAEADPRVQHVFTTWLDVFTDRSAPLVVTSVPAPDGIDGDCFAVEPSLAALVAPVEPGTYCYAADGTITGAQLGLGTLTLRTHDEAAPESVTLPGPVVTGDPAPTAAPTGVPGDPSQSPGAAPTMTDPPAGG